MLNVLHLVSGRSFTGPVAAALADVRSLVAAEHRAWLASRSGTALEAGSTTQDVPFLGGFRFGKGPARLLNLPRDAKHLRELCHEHEIDVIHVHRSQEQMLVGWAFGRRSGPSVVRSWHRSPARVSKPLRRHMAAAVKGNICVAHDHMKALAAVGAPCVSYVPPAVDTDRFRPTKKSPGDIPRIGLIGRWKAGEDRGQRAFLEVLARIQSTVDRCGVLLGRGEGRQELLDRIAEYPCKDRIELLETSDQFARQVAALDIGLVFATGSDGTSRPAAELLASGVPVLLADRPGLRELGEDNDGARILPATDLDAWARVCEAWLAAPGERHATGSAARRFAEEQLGLAVRGRTLAAVYEKICSA